MRFIIIYSKEKVKLYNGEFVQKIIVDAVNRIRGLTIRKAESKLLFANFR